MAEISIIIPVYNTEKYLDRCLETVTGQIFHDLEIILIDDGSTDHSLEKCKEWKNKDDRIIVVHQSNAGAGAARNAGLKIASGKYIGFVDSDDWIQKDMYAKLYDMLREHPDAQMAMCGTWRTSKKKQREDNCKPVVMTVEEMLRQFFREKGGESDFGIYSKLIYRELLNEFSFIEGTVSEDVMASYYFITHSEKIVYTSEKLYCYFDNNNTGVTRKKAGQKDFEYIEAFRRINQDVEKYYPALQDLARQNEIRANFTILSKMKLYGYDRSNEELKQTYHMLKTVVRKNFLIIFRMKMSFSRKVLLVIDCL